MALGALASRMGRTMAMSREGTRVCTVHNTSNCSRVPPCLAVMFCWRKDDLHTLASHFAETSVVEDNPRV